MSKKKYFSISFSALVLGFATAYIIWGIPEEETPTPAPLENITSVNESAQNPSVKPEVIKSQELEDQVYTNKEYGFFLSFPNSWQDIQTIAGTEDTEYESIDFGFFLPVEEPYQPSEFDELPGYTKTFTISAFTHAGWQAFSTDWEQGVIPSQLGEELGSNASYTIVYYDADGGIVEYPQDFLDELRQIKLSFTALKPELEPKPGIATKKTSTIQYDNCLYNYSIFYPENWTNNATNTSESLIFTGDDLTVSVQTHQATGSLEDVSQIQMDLVSGEIVDSRNQERHGVNIIAYETTEPNSVQIFWPEQDKILQFSISGTGYLDHPEIISDLVTLLTINTTPESCGG